MNQLMTKWAAASAVCSFVLLNGAAAQAAMPELDASAPVAAVNAASNAATQTAVKPAHAAPILLSTEPAPPNTTDDVLIAENLIPFQNVWADDHGRTHVSHCVLKGLKLHGFAPPAAPYYMGVAPEDIQSIVYSVLPVGWYGDWHHAPGPQWVIDLSGEWEIKTADGTTLRQGPGQIQFNSDQGAFAEKAGDPVGHTARQVGDAPDVRVIITLKKKPGKHYDNQACVL
ncbi:exported hypothetical protein [Paraburkholderia tropica]|uniref:hypothetical protein n=1 Tax=Paraburkholderia TaxID=1822464 RepID=UPI001CB43B87|nr:MULTISPECIES: hypothetical protein [Paraburkholderia]CAG9233205.1 exported hypothetical protein [Paraburkholderia tropica]